MQHYYFISAGDVSGDIRASELVSEIKKAKPETKIVSVGGEQLKKHSDRFLFNTVDLNGFGFLSAIRLYFKLKDLLKNEIYKIWKENAPSKVILVDYYGFNIHIAKLAKRNNIPVYYYISPQVWATRRGRIKSIAKYVDRMITILPFEKKLYESEGVKCDFVGHPMLDKFSQKIESNSEFQKPVIGLFPGSRKGVILRHLKLFKEAADLIIKDIDCQFKVFTLDKYREECETLGFDVVTENTIEERKNINFAVSVSGTVSLENALLGIPMVVIYKLSWINYLIAKLLVKVEYITMANILKNKMLVVELIQKDATPGNVKRETIKILKNKALYSSIREELLSLKHTLGEKGAPKRASEIILEN